jgi:tetratricopeptide (TPR) repeat protein
MRIWTARLLGRTRRPRREGSQPEEPAPKSTAAAQVSTVFSVLAFCLSALSLVISARQLSTDRRLKKQGYVREAWEVLGGPSSNYIDSTTEPGKLWEAIRRARLALTIDQDYEEALTLVARADLILGNIGDAARIIGKLGETRPEDPSTFAFLRARMEMEKQEWDRAIAILEAARADERRRGDERFLTALSLGYGYERAGRTEDDIREYTRAAALDDRSWQAHLHLGHELLKVPGPLSPQQVGTALKHLLTAASLKPMAPAHQYAAMAYQILSRFDQALAEIDKAIQLDQANPNLREDKARFLWSVDRRGEALDLLESTLPLGGTGCARLLDQFIGSCLERDPGDCSLHERRARLARWERNAELEVEHSIEARICRAGGHVSR